MLMGQHEMMDRYGHEILRQAKELKDSANNHVKDKNFKDADVKYKKALKILETAYSESKEILDLKQILFQNRALVLNEIEKYDESIDCCRKALVINDQSVKALYRRAVAL
jgi:tetratricopeptide (TPR) repeat protein